MVLNPLLYRVLVEEFGDVKIYNEGIERKEITKPGERGSQVIEPGESYNVCCKFCGDDKNRLSISHRWLERRSRFDGNPIRGLIHCYNENCEQDMPEDFIDGISERIAFFKAMYSRKDLEKVVAKARCVSAKKQKGIIPLPKGCVPLYSLPEDHPAIQFMLSNYKGLRGMSSIRYLSRYYDVQWTEDFDEQFPLSQDRVIFPIWDGDGKQVAWQGRTIHSDNGPRWFLPPGFVKVFYNLHRVSWERNDTPILTEGVLNAIFCGPKGIAMFGRSLNSFRAAELGSKSNEKEGFDRIILATDPDTYVPDNRPGGKGKVYVEELKKILAPYIPNIRLIRWPPDVLRLAERSNNGEKVKVPDHADLGRKVMRKLIKEADK